MAPRTKTENGTAPKRARRTPEQQIADLQAEIKRVKARAAAREAKASASGKAFMAAVKAMDKALSAAQGDGDEAMAKALERARAALGEHLVAMGVRAPQTKRGRPRKGEAA